MSAACGPSTSATATARFSATIGTGRDRQQLIVELQDLPPVRRGRGGRVAVDGVDRRLDLVWAGRLRRRHRRTSAWPSAMRRAIPEAPVLIGEQDEVAVRGRARGASRLDEQHQREQPHDLRFVGHQLREEPSEADGFRAQILADEPLARARRVALVEYEVDDRQHRAKAARKVGLAREP